MSNIILIDENFRSFHTGYFPSDISALGEYHFNPPKGYTGIWYEPNKSTAWQGRKCWMIRECEGEHLLEQEMDLFSLPWFDDTIPMLVSGVKDWKGYTLRVELQALACRGFCGTVFGYSDSRHFHMFVLEAGKDAVLYRKSEDNLEELERTEYKYDCDHVNTMEVQLDRTAIRCRINESEIFTLMCYSCPPGRIALAASNPARFHTVRLEMKAEYYCNYISCKKAESERVHLKCREFPAPRLWKVINLKDFGSARSIRYGDLSGKGNTELLFIQSMPCLNSEDESMISCLTAVDMDGRVLWQIGEPCRENNTISRDLPVQIYDIDGDGLNEVIYCKDFNLIIADGRTGRTIKRIRTPESIFYERFTIFQNTTFSRIVGDSIRICDFSGAGRPSDILLKDRYNNLWVYDSCLRLIWHRSLNTGHFPFSLDINGDGREELMVGYSLLDSKGGTIWDIPDMTCHVDEIIIGRFDPGNEKMQIAMAAGEDGFLLADIDGRILVQEKIGHVQRISAANYIPELPGLEIAVVTFWRNTGIIVLFDCKGNRIHSREPGANGNIICPVNWTGDGRELMLYSASTRFGGLFDGYGDRMVAFPEDGHPDLCCDAVNLTGDEREELLAWDASSIYIYTQEDSLKQTSYTPQKYPLYNYSNYRGEYSFPAWRVPERHKNASDTL